MHQSGFYPSPTLHSPLLCLLTWSFPFPLPPLLWGRTRAKCGRRVTNLTEDHSSAKKPGPSEPLVGHWTPPPNTVALMIVAQGREAEWKLQEHCDDEFSHTDELPCGRLRREGRTRPTWRRTGGFACPSCSDLLALFSLDRDSVTQADLLLIGGTGWAGKTRAIVTA